MKNGPQNDPEPGLSQSLTELMSTISKLRSPEGCPWDREQTRQSLIPYLIEESIELAEALRGESVDEWRDELADVLFQVLIHCQIAEEEGSLNFLSVINHLNSKLIARHPHVFAGEKAESIEAVWTLWEREKKRERESKPNKTHDFHVSMELPSLQRAQKLGQKACHERNFDWKNIQGVIAKIEEEWSELKEHLQTYEKDKHGAKEELGDLLFTLAQLGRHLDIPAEEAGHLACRKFQSRFEKLLTSSRASEDQKTLEKTWKKIKQSESRKKATRD